MTIGANPHVVAAICDSHFFIQPDYIVLLPVHSDATLGHYANGSTIYFIFMACACDAAYILWWLLLYKVFYNWLILLNVLFYSRFTVKFSHDLVLARTAWNILCKRIFLIMITGARLTYWHDRSCLVVYIFMFAVCRDSGVWFYLPPKPYNHCKVFYTLTIICSLWLRNKI